MSAQSDSRGTQSTAGLLASLRPALRLKILSSQTDEDVAGLMKDWSFWLRENQLPPERSLGHIVWMPMAGRGWGKTLCGAYATQQVAESGKVKHIYIIGSVAKDVRDVMIRGVSGILAVAPDHFRPTYQPSNSKLTWPNGVEATTYSAIEPESLRGPAAGFAWCDEIAKWRYGMQAWDQMMLGMREGVDPWVVATTTPKPTDLVRMLVEDDTTLVTHGTTYENMANLAEPFKKVVRRYEGTALGEQELYAKLLDEARGALWKRTWLDSTRIANKDHVPALFGCVIAVDPAVTANEESSSETGIVVCALGADGHGYVLEDLSGVYTADEWPEVVKAAFYRHRADCIIAERNNGGDLVEKAIRNAEFRGEHLPVRTVWAKKGKHTRAQPISMLWEPGQARAHMVGSFGDLEDQLRTWTPGDDSPDRLDAMVWGMTALFFPEEGGADLENLPWAA